jgi:hypothetical protein
MYICLSAELMTASLSTVSCAGQMAEVEGRGVSLMTTQRLKAVAMRAILLAAARGLSRRREVDLAGIRSGSTSRCLLHTIAQGWRMVADRRQVCRLIRMNDAVCVVHRPEFFYFSK